MYKDNGIIIGIHYEYPFGGMANRAEWLPQGEADWRRDLAAIKETGFDAVRIRIGFDSSLDEVACLLDICQELGLRVLFGFATFYVADSFFEEFPDAKVVDRHGKAYPIDQYDYRWQRACIDHPQYRARRDQLVVDCVTRFGSHPAVFAWDIHNEPSIGPGDHPCYCPHTLAKYREDLAGRFASIGDLNRRFGTAFDSFSAVEPPREPESSLTGFWHDWRDFAARNLSDFLLGGMHIIKERLPDVPASFNFTHAFGPQHGGQDWWIASQLDYASHSNYPGAAPQTTSEAGARIDLLKACAPGKDVWVTEFQGGPFANYVLWRGINIEAEVNKVFSHGCRALFVYRWDPLMCGPEPWINGLTEPDTYDTERRLAMKRVIAELREQEVLIGSGKRAAPRVAIYLPRQMVWAAGAREAPLYQTVNGLYGLFVDLGYEVQFISEPFRADCDLALVAVPFTLDLTEVERDALQGYLGRGGRVIAELPMTNLADCQAASEWLGLRCREWMRPIYFIAGWSINNDEGRFGGYAFHDRVLLDGFTGQAVATYRDNAEPALIAAGPEGRLLIPTFALGRSYFSSFHQGLRTTIGSWLPPSLEPDIRIAGVPDEYRALVEARVLESPQGSLLFVINRSGYDWEIEVCPRGYREVRVKLPTYGAVRQTLTPVPAAG
jgi:beta-galactosidase GanA